VIARTTKKPSTGMFVIFFFGNKNCRKAKRKERNTTKEMLFVVS